jgi:hypothetical protein
MNIAAINNYKNLVEEMPNIIDLSGYKNEYIARKIEMKPQYFSVKKQKNTFNLAEVEKILSVIFNNDVEDYILLLELRSRKNDETVTMAEYKKEIAAWK